MQRTTWEKIFHKQNVVLHFAVLWNVKMCFLMKVCRYMQIIQEGKIKQPICIWNVLQLHKYRYKFTLCLYLHIYLVYNSLKYPSHLLSSFCSVVINYEECQDFIKWHWKMATKNSFAERDLCKLLPWRS